MRLLGLCLALITTAASAQAPPAAQDFRVDTKIFEVRGGKPQEAPLAEIRTLFTQTPTGEVVYDFLLGDSPETTILDMARGRMALISPKRRVVTELYVSNVFEVAMAIRNRAPEGEGPLFAPQFKVQRDDELLTMDSEALRYEIKLLDPKFDSAPGRYQLFATWAARLNSMRPPNPPSTGRERVNQQVADAGRVPLEVRRTIRHRGRKVEVMSKHAYIWALGASDRAAIATTQEQRATCTPVSIEDYLQIRPAPAQQAAK